MKLKFKGISFVVIFLLLVATFIFLLIRYEFFGPIVGAILFVISLIFAIKISISERWKKGVKSFFKALWELTGW